MSDKRLEYDLIIVGAGIAGTECALKAAESKQSILLVTTSLDTVYNLLGDGVLLRPHPGTFMAKTYADIANKAGFVGNWAMHRVAKHAVEMTENIHFLQSNVSALITEAKIVKGISTWEGVPRYGKKIVLAVGSFLKSRLTIGSLTETSGRLSEMSYDELYENLESLGLSFKDLVLKAEFEDASLPYEVSCKVISEKLEQGRVATFDNLYLVGVCASGFLSYEDAALDGVKLAENLV